MTYALLAKVNEAEEAVSRGSFSEAIRIQCEVRRSGVPLWEVASDLIDTILRDAMHERATADEVRPQ